MEKGQIKTLPRIILEKGFERKRGRSFLLLFQKRADNVNRHGEDGSGVLLRGDLRQGLKES
jgi:hypothetical protein